jgi:hypothetical protein
LNDFHAFDKEISISFPPSEYSLFLVKAFDEDQLFQADQGYIVNYYLEGLNTGQSFSNYQAGYLNRFTKYLTFLHAAYTGFDLSYEAYGGIPSATSIVVANPDLAITDKSFGNFTASSNDFQFRTSTWFARHSLNGARMATVWNVKSDNDHLKNPVTIPQILTDKYPNIIGGTFTHDLTIFNKGTKTFADVVAENFKGVAVKPYEQIRKAIQ